MATKKTTRKNSEDEIRKNAFYFFQGKEGRVENLDGLAFFQAVPKLSDEQILEQAKNLAKANKQPKYSIVTRTYYTAEEAEAINKLRKAEEGDENYLRTGAPKDVKHTEMAIYRADDDPLGTYGFFFPDIYKREPASKYLIDGQVYDAESFTINDYKAWNTHLWDNKLNEVFAKQQKAQEGLQALEPSDKEIESLQNDIDRQGENLQTLKKVYDKELLDLDADFDASEKRLANISGRISLTVTALKEKEAKLKTWRAGVETIENAEKTGPLRKKLEDLNEQSYRVYAMFFYDVAEQRPVDGQGFEPWYADLTSDDKDNIMLWVAEGNARRMSGRAVGPMSREQERELELTKLAKLPN